MRSCQSQSFRLETTLVPFGTPVASFHGMTYASYKTVEVSTIRSTLTPCIFDDDPAERDSLIWAMNPFAPAMPKRHSA